MFEGERVSVLSVSASHGRTLLKDSSPNDLNAKQRPRALAKKDNNWVDEVGGRGQSAPEGQKIREFETKCELC